MVSIDHIKAFEFFNGLTLEQLGSIASLSRELDVEEGYLFFAEGDQVDYFYLILQGQVDICLDVVEPVENCEQNLEGADINRFMSVCKLKAGDVFGWTSLVPPYITQAGALAQTTCKILAVDTRQLEIEFKKDMELGYKMAIKTAQLIRDRVRDLRLESVNHTLQTAGRKPAKR